MNAPPQGDPPPLPDAEQESGPWDAQPVTRGASRPVPAAAPGEQTDAPGEPPTAADEPRPAYDRLVRAVSGRASLAVAFAWGLAEAAILPVVPDAWLGFVALYAPRRTVVTLLAIVAGAVAGAAVLLVATRLAGDAVTGVLVALPGIGTADLAQARLELGVQGTWAFLNGPVQGLPVKVYIHGAALDELDAIGVLTGTALNRVERIGIVGLVMAFVGLVGRPVIARWPRAIAVGYALAWAIFYLAYWWGAAG